jgi:hypothetical protein
LQLKSVFADRFENRLFVWLPRRDDGSANGKRNDALLAQGLDQLRRGFRAERGFLFCGGVEEQRSILGDDAIEKINPGKDADKIGQLPSGDEKKLPARSPEGAERVRGCVVDDSIMRKRAVIVGRQTADVHECLRRSSLPILAERPKDRRSSYFNDLGPQQPRAKGNNARSSAIYSGEEVRRGLTPGDPGPAERDKWWSAGGYGRFWSMGAWRRLPRRFAKTPS